MITKRHGPGRRLEVIDLAACPDCAGQGWTKGLFHDLKCNTCGASGMVSKETGEALPAEVLVLQLRLRLNQRDRRLAQLEGSQQSKGGPHEDYRGKRNPAGIGGGNWTGD